MIVVAQEVSHAAAYVLAKPAHWLWNRVFGVSAESFAPASAHQIAVMTGSTTRDALILGQAFARRYKVDHMIVDRCRFGAADPQTVDKDLRTIVKFNATLGAYVISGNIWDIDSPDVSGKFKEYLLNATLAVWLLPPPLWIEMLRVIVHFAVHTCAQSKGVCSLRVLFKNLTRVWDRHEEMRREMRAAMEIYTVANRMNIHLQWPYFVLTQ